MATQPTNGSTNTLGHNDSAVDLVPVDHSNSDLEVLRSSNYADFMIVCQNVLFPAHRAFLHRNPYFRVVVSENGRFRETAQGMIRIHDFEPFEVDWLMVYIYGGSPLVLDPEVIKQLNPSGSFFDTCVRLYTIGDYFLEDRLCDFAMQELRYHAIMKPKDYRVAAMSKRVPYLTDLEDGIRAAWMLDRNTDATRIPLLDLCRDTSPYLAGNPSFAELLDDVPEFASDLAKTLLGFRSPSLPRVQKDPVCGRCIVCKIWVVKSSGEAGRNTGSGAEAGSNADAGDSEDKGSDASEVMLFPASSFAFGSRQQRYVCSQKCLQQCTSFDVE